MLQRIANVVRGLSADMVQEANSGHPGMPLGCAEIATVLFSEVLKHDPSDPDWPDRDRFVLSAGHGSALLYSLLHLTGYGLTLDDLKHFRQLGSITPGHPEYGETPGVETTSGPLGQGIGTGVGMAIAERMLAERFNRTGYNIVDHYTFVLAGDGCMMEGISAEASSLAGHLGLGKLIVIYDSNRITIEGGTDLAFSESVVKRYEAYDWHVQEIDGHDLQAIQDAIAAAKQQGDKPSLIVARTRIGKGAPGKENTSSAHGEPLGDEVIEGLKENLGLPSKRFHVPEEVTAFFKSKQSRWREKHNNWETVFKKWGKDHPELAELWEAGSNLQVKDLDGILPVFPAGGKIATRASAGKVLQQIAEATPGLIGGAADLSPSTKTRLVGEDDVVKGSFSGRNLHFGVREHGMAAILNGISLHGGFRVFGATFLVFADYMRPSIRLAAMMKQPVIYVLTHDSIYVGEDGPTHQPVEQTESLRIIPNLRLFRPADANESRAAWIAAMNHTGGPTALVLTRQELDILDPALATPAAVQKGGYILKPEDSATPDAILAASGSEVHLALSAARQLSTEGIDCRVVSIPCRELFLQQEEEYRNSVIEAGVPLVVIEAGVGTGWAQITGRSPASAIIAMNTFGASGPGGEVAALFGFTADNVIETVKSLINQVS